MDEIHCIQLNVTQKHDELYFKTVFHSPMYLSIIDVHPVVTCSYKFITLKGKICKRHCKTSLSAVQLATLG